jgi:predicted XRE-type DNA-binding protein
MPDVDPVDELKRALGAEIARHLTGWRAADAAVLLRTDRARISDLRAMKNERFSLAKLVRMACTLGVAVELRARSAARRSGAIVP